ALYFLQRYCESERLMDGVAFVAAAVLSLYAKQLTIMVFPVYVLRFCMTFGIGRLFSRRALLAIATIGILATPIVLLTLKYSQFNVQVVTTFVTATARVAGRNLYNILRAVTVFQAAWPVVALAAASVVAAIAFRDRFALLLFSWIVSVYAGLGALGVRDP